MSTDTTTNDSAPLELAPSPKAWSIGLWVPQVLLAAMFGFAGVLKTFTPIEELAATINWAADLPRLARFIGVSELAGALGLILPAATRIRPVLTPLAAAGLVVIMILAAAYHVTRGELSAVPMNVVLGAVAALVAWGRWRKAPITAR